jgi:hypothetical protein
VTLDPATDDLRPGKIAEFLMQNVKPLKGDYSGQYYRAAAYLRDNTYLPCVMFANPAKLVDLAIRRFAANSQVTGFT